MSAFRKLSLEQMLSAKQRVVWERLQCLFCQSCNNWTQIQHLYVHHTLFLSGLSVDLFSRPQHLCSATHVNLHIRFAMSLIGSESTSQPPRQLCSMVESQFKPTKTCCVMSNLTSSLEHLVESYNLQKRRA